MQGENPLLLKLYPMGQGGCGGRQAYCVSVFSDVAVMPLPHNRAMTALPILVPIAIVTTTVDSAEAAQQLAQAAIQARWAACAQVQAITSHYVWQAQLRQSAEWRIVLKTVPSAVAALRQWLQQAHPYALPQLLLRTEQADPSYADWVAAQVQSPASVPVRS